MINFEKGNILHSNAEALVNTVNCVGVMGRGIALQFKKAYPENYKAYKKACDNKLVKPGQVFTYETGPLSSPRFIINFPTKRHWKDKSRLDDIKTGLNNLVETLKKLDIKSISIPSLGCGLGGLDWKEVRPLIEKALTQLPNTRVIIFEPSHVIKAANTEEKVSMTPGRATLICLIKKYLDGLMDPFLSLLEVHKLMYFMQESGEDLKLNYKKAHYGPYAENLRHVLKKIEGHFITGYGDGGDAPTTQLKLLPKAYDNAQNYLNTHLVTKSRFDRVSDLVEGFETSFGLELLSTVHWIVTREKTKSGDEVIEKTFSWNNRKKQFSPDQIRLAIQILKGKRWI